MSRTAAGPGVGRWRGMAGFEIVRKNDPRWFRTQPPKAERKRCRSCVFEGQPVRMRIWHEARTFTWRCPCCAFSLPAEQTYPVT